MFRFFKRVYVGAFVGVEWIRIDSEAALGMALKREIQAITNLFKLTLGAPEAQTNWERSKSAWHTNWGRSKSAHICVYHVFMNNINKYKTIFLT